MSSSSKTFKTPILFLVFNRPDLTQKVFEKIRKVRPGRLYVAADGPRQDCSADVDACIEARRIATDVDWNCDVRTLFRERNLGCGRAVKEAIDWFFNCEEEGIILEDDCLPEPCFFPYCEEMLDWYRDEQQVAMISGFNGIPRSHWQASRIHLTAIPHIWGWATWRRAWSGAMPTLDDWRAFRDSERFGSTIGCPRAEMFWKNQMDQFFEGKIDTWDLPWVLKIWIDGGLSISPGVNLVKNVGFDERGTHTRANNPAVTSLAAGGLCFPLRAGKAVPDRRWERSVYRHLFGIRGPSRTARLRKMLNFCRRAFR